MALDTGTGEEAGRDAVAPAIVARVRGLERVHGKGAAARRVLAGVDLDVREGEMVAIVGPSGSGKSTLLSLLGGLDRPTSGSIVLAGRRLDRLSERELAGVRQRQVGFVFQSFRLVPELSAWENAVLPARLAGDLAGGRRRAEALFDELGVDAVRRQLPPDLSGGEQQRVALARALVMDPTLVLADEPTGNLDAAAGAAVLELLRRSVARQRAVVLVTHDASHAELADRTVRLRDGRVV